MEINGLDAQKKSIILRIMKRCGLKSVVEELAKCDTNKLNALFQLRRLTTEMISFAIQFNGDGSVFGRIVTLLNNRFSLCEEVIEVAKDQEKTTILCEARDYINMFDIFDVFNPTMNAEQFEEILKGFQRGIHSNRIRYYADKRFSAEQMREIRKAFRNGLSDEYVIFIAESGLSAECMRQMRKGLERGLSKLKVQVYAKEFLDAEQMHQIRRVFEEGYDISFACFVANQNFSAKQMARVREGFESGFSIEQVETYIYLPEEQLKEKLSALQEAELKKYLN